MKLAQTLKERDGSILGPLELLGFWPYKDANMLGMINYVQPQLVRAKCILKGAELKPQPRLS